MNLTKTCGLTLLGRQEGISIYFRVKRIPELEVRNSTISMLFRKMKINIRRIN